jgi:hypothetical protein
MDGMEIRTFGASDRAVLRDLFGRAGAGSPSGSLWGHEESEAAVYLTPYMDLEPDSLFIAVVDGALTGYLTGCLDSFAFPSETERLEKTIRKYRLIFRARPLRSGHIRRRDLRSPATANCSRLRRCPVAGPPAHERATGRTWNWRRQCPDDPMVRAAPGVRLARVSPTNLG